MRHQRCDDRTRTPLVSFGLAAALRCAAIACGSDVNPGSGSLGTSPPASVAKEAFCQDLGDVIEAVDGYGRVFVEDQVTVGQLESSGGASPQPSPGWSRRPRRSPPPSKPPTSRQRRARDPPRRRRFWRRSPPTTTCAPSARRSGPSTTRSTTSTPTRRSPRSPQSVQPRASGSSRPTSRCSSTPAASSTTSPRHDW